MKFLNNLIFILPIIFHLTVISTGKKVDIELAYKLLLEDQLKNNGRIFGFGDKDCELSCPANSFLIQKPDNVFDMNGCGSYNVNIDFAWLNMNEFNDCCNVHDVCYELCDRTKDGCDGAFGKCLSGHCDRWAIEGNWGPVQKLSCSSVVKLMTLAVENLGCKAYKDSREKACYCSNN